MCLLSAYFLRLFSFPPALMYNGLARYGLGQRVDKIKSRGRHIVNSHRTFRREDAHFHEVKQSRKTDEYTAEVYWTTSNTAKKICLLRNACVQRDGSLVLHSSLRKHEDYLRQCHALNISFLRFSEESDQTITHSDFNLIGSIPARFHIPHFLTDVLSAIYSIEFIWPISQHQGTVYRCFAPSDESCAVKQMSSRPMDLDNLKTALLVENRVLGMRSELWVPMFASLLFRNPKLVSLQSLFKQNTAETIHCFKSIVAYDPGKYNLEKVRFNDNNRFFHENKLKRNRDGHNQYITNSRNDVQALSTKEYSHQPLHRTCNITILILNRGLSERRCLLQASEIKNGMKKSFTEISEIKIRSTIFVEYFENLKFEEQVKKMQQADIIIGVHGAGLANIVFARQGTYFLEVFPFLYYAGPFKTIAHTMGLYYDSYVAYPDFQSYSDCINAMAKKRRIASLTAKARKLWDEALRDSGGSTRTMDFSTIHDSIAGHLRFCARQQQLRVQIDGFISIATAMTKSFCKV